MQKKSLVAFLWLAESNYNIFRNTIADIVTAHGLFFFPHKNNKKGVARIERTVKGRWRWMVDFFLHSERNEYQYVPHKAVAEVSKIGHL